VQEVISALVFIAVGIGVCLDLFSCYVELRRNRGLGKTSGLLGVTLIACYLLPLVLSGRSVITASAWADAAILFAFHAGVVLLIPWADRVRNRGKAGGLG
jgi:hypothetical protein